MKNYYSLIGRDAQVEDWVLTFKDLPPELPRIETFEKMLTSSSWPVLHYEQIPERFFKEDPGFPILLRTDHSEQLPKWIHRPVLPTSKDFSGRYIIHTPNNRTPKRILFSIAHDFDLDWEKICGKYPAIEHRIIWNSDIRSLPRQLKLPKESVVGMGGIIHQKDYVPDLLIDFSFGISDTYSPIHLHLLQVGCDIETFLERPKLKIDNQKTLNRSEWIIFA